MMNQDFKDALAEYSVTIVELMAALKKAEDERDHWKAMFEKSQADLKLYREGYGDCL